MPRIQHVSSINAAPAASQANLQLVKEELGSIPNLYWLLATSPAALHAYLGISSALEKGALSPATQERIALAVGQINQCEYCLAAHSYISRKVFKHVAAEIAVNRAGRSEDKRANFAVHFAAQVAQQRGHLLDSDVQAVKDAGYSDAEIIEIIAQVALNTMTNYMNVVAQTKIDFPKIEPLLLPEPE
jgi:uncharacterized peroxidase-related enzyme